MITMADSESSNSAEAYQALLQFFTSPLADLAEPIYHPDEQVNQQAKREVASYRDAAVLIPVTKHSGENRSEIVLTVRSAHLKSHAGQISLPGGTKEEQDPDFQTTALRESEEEIGLPPEKVQVLGKLGNMALPSGFCITPFVGLIDSGLPLVASPDEVAEVFSAPLELILDPGAYRHSTMAFDGAKRAIVELNYEHYRIWGATAAILYHLAKQVKKSISD